MRDLDTPTGPGSYGLAINSGGEVVGIEYQTNGTFGPFADINGKMTYLSLEAGFGQAAGVNNSGEIVGYIQHQPFLYANGTWTDLSFEPLAINDEGDIVGNNYVTGLDRGRSVSRISIRWQ